MTTARANDDDKATSSVKFPDSLRIDNDLLMDLVSRNSQRVICPHCKTSQATYCPFCCVGLNHSPPQMCELPISLHIYRHKGEKAEESTTVHCKLVAPNQTTIFEDNETLDMELTARYPDPSRVVLLYPTENSLLLEDIEEGSFDTLAVIDGTWSQAKKMARRFGKFGFRHVRIQERETLFWRYQSLNRGYLATIEAIYYFMVEYAMAFEVMKDGGDKDKLSLETSSSFGDTINTKNTTSTLSTATPTPNTTNNTQISKVKSSNGKVYDGRYDNLLFYFKFKFEIIQQFYRKRPEKKFTSKHELSESFITYD